MADTTTGYSGMGSPDINNAGTVVFTAIEASGAAGLYTGPNPAVDALLTTAGPYSLLNPASINNNGEYVFQALLDISAGGHGGVFRGPNPATHTVASSSGPFNNFANRPVLNDFGAVAFAASLDANEGGIYRGPNPSTDAVATTHGSFAQLSNPAINDAGTVAFIASFDGSDPDASGLFTGPDPVANAVATSAGAFGRFVESPDINDAGKMVFLARLDTGEMGVFTGPDPVADRVATAHFNLPWTDFLGKPAINNAGTVAFFARGGPIGNGIFTGPDLVADKVIQVGDTLFGQVVSEVSFAGGLNDTGDVAFGYRLSNGVSGIAVASVPEPATLGVLAFGATALSFATSRRRRSRRA